MISITIFLFIGMLPLLDSLGWVSLESLANGPDPEQFYLPGWFFTFALYSLIVAGGVIASGPVARTLRDGGGLFAHPLNLLIVAFFVSSISYGLVNLIIDQWPCFMGVPMCD